MSQRAILLTGDGSPTIFHEGLDEIYHSRHGAFAESMHVFIQEGLQYQCSHKEDQANLKILEVGWGTGLNAALSFSFVEKHQQDVSLSYVGLEPDPIPLALLEEYRQHSFFETRSNIRHHLNHLHEMNWGWNESTKDFQATFYELDARFKFVKLKQELQSFQSLEKFDLIYFDAFAPEVQMELWSLDMFKQLKALCHQGSVMVTYCAKGVVRRTMEAAGFKVDRIPGPPGKREMLRAYV